MPVAHVDRTDALVERRGQGDGEVGMVSHIDTAVVATTLSCCHGGHIASLQNEGTGLVAVAAQVGGIAQRHRKRALVGSSHEGCLCRKRNDHRTAHPDFHAAVNAVLGFLTVDGYVAEIGTDDLAGTDALEHEPRGAAIQVDAAEVFERRGADDVVIDARDFNRFRDAVVVLLLHAVFVGKDCGLSHLSGSLEAIAVGGNDGIPGERAGILVVIDGHLVSTEIISAAAVEIAAQAGAGILLADNVGVEQLVDSP